jgi:protein TonB
MGAKHKPSKRAPPEPTPPSKPAPAGHSSAAKQGKRENYRGGLFDQIDVPAAASLLGCALLFLLALVGVRSIDYSSLNKPSLEDLPDRVAKIIMPLKPSGKAAEKPKAAASPRRGNANGTSAAGADAGAAGRIERSRRTVSEQIVKVQERITRAGVLSILSGKGPGAAGAAVGRRPKGMGFTDWGDMDSKLGKLEGLTKFDAKKGSSNQDGSVPEATREGPAAATAGIDKLVKGFQNAKMGALTKMGVTELEKPALIEGSTKYNGNRNVSEIAAFISKKQAAIGMMYEERLKVNPTLEGKITVVMVIEEDGTVSSADVMRSETTLDDSDFQSDLLRRIKHWVFPPSTGGAVEMKSPFIFKPA